MGVAAMAVAVEEEWLFDIMRDESGQSQQTGVSCDMEAFLTARDGKQRRLRRRHNVRSEDNTKRRCDLDHMHLIANGCIRQYM